MAAHLRHRVLVALAAFGISCSDSTSDSSSGGTDGGTDAPASPGDAGPGDAGPRTTSPLLVSSNVLKDTAGGVGDTNLIFFNAGSPPCPYALVGPCHTWACGARDASAVVLAAGAITLEGGGTKLTIAPTADGTYSVDRPVGVEAWSLGAALTFKGAGGADVTAFTQVLTAPASELTLTSPAAPEPGAGVWWTMKVDRTKDLSVAWSAPTTGVVGIGVTANIAAPTAIDATRLYCTFDASAGTATIPAAALAVLAKATGASVLVAAETNAEIRAGGYTILARVARARRIDVSFE